MSSNDSVRLNVRLVKHITNAIVADTRVGRQVDIGCHGVKTLFSAFSCWSIAYTKKFRCDGIVHGIWPISQMYVKQSFYNSCMTHNTGQGWARKFFPRGTYFCWSVGVRTLDKIIIWLKKGYRFHEFRWGEGGLFHQWKTVVIDCDSISYYSANLDALGFWWF